VSYLVDTNILSEIRKGKACDASVRRWWEAVAADEVYLSVLVLGEIRRGIELRRRNDPVQANVLGAWLTRLETVYVDRILNVDTAVADLWGRLQVPNPLPVIDGVVSATALVHDLTLVTPNVGDVSTTGVRIVDPFASAPPQ
jgi:predicted nucleic acid-binding protein